MRMLWREERPALPPRRNQAVGVLLAEACDQAQAKAQCVAVAGGKWPLALSSPRWGEGDT